MNTARASLTALLMSAATLASAQPLPPEAQLPGWAQQQFKALAASRALQISTRINPFVWRGDFNGDGRQDLAVWVRATASGKEGIAFLLQGSAAQLVGAGVRIGSAGDDLAWIELWNVEDRGTRPKSYHAPSHTLKADGLTLGREGAASGLVYFQAGQPVWQQQGD